MGDVLMRLNALYALSSLRGNLRIRVVVGGALLSLAETLYGSRLQIGTTTDSTAATYVFTHSGLRHLLPELLKGRRFINPFVRELAQQTGRSRWKGTLNVLAFRLLHHMDRVLLPRSDLGDSYAGWSQICGLPLALDIPYDQARAQLTRDLPQLRRRLRQLVPKAAGRCDAPTVFPSGTTFQVMPVALAVELARRYGARFAFHSSDRYQDVYRAAGLDVVCFADTAGLLAVASASSRVVSTDSFPSHLLQLYSASTVVALSQRPSRHVVHPGFDGGIIESTAPCCPCVNHARAVTTVCPVGRVQCLVWTDEGYLRSLRDQLDVTVGLAPQTRGLPLHP